MTSIPLQKFKHSRSNQQALTTDLKHLISNHMELQVFSKQSQVVGQNDEMAMFPISTPGLSVGRVRIPFCATLSKVPR